MVKKLRLLLKWRNYCDNGLYGDDEKAPIKAH